MQDMSERKNKWRRLRHWARIPLAVSGAWIILMTEVNFNPPHETFLDPTVTAEQAAEAIAADDRPTIFRFAAQKAEEDDIEMLRYTAGYYSIGFGVRHPDHCRAFDNWFKAMKRGDLSSQIEVARYLKSGFGGLYDPAIGYVLAKNAEIRGYKEAKRAIEVHFNGFPSLESVSELDKIAETFSIEDQEIPDAIKMPIVPIVSKIISEFFLIRRCHNPTVIQHLLSRYPDQR